MSARDDLPFRLKRSAKRQFGALSHSRQKHCFCVAKTFARLDRANDYLPGKYKKTAAKNCGLSLFCYFLVIDQ